MSNPPLWRAWTRAPLKEAGNVAALFQLIPNPAPLAVSATGEVSGPDSTIEALYEKRPDEKLLSKILNREVKVEALPDRDWVRHSQHGLPPVRAGRFFVYGAHDKGKAPPNVVPLRIEAGHAFGSGHHETTRGCLLAIDGLISGKSAASPPSCRFATSSPSRGEDKTCRFFPSPLEGEGARRSCEAAKAGGRGVLHALDLGTGTAVLALAVAKTANARVIAADIDPDAVAVARENVRLNGGQMGVRVLRAGGFAHPEIHRAAPFGLIVANILSGPLLRLSRDIAAHSAPGGTLILSGLLDFEEAAIRARYAAHGFVTGRRIALGPWVTLVMDWRRPIARDRSGG